jgi:hypothetical protein
MVGEFRERWRILRHITTGHLLLPFPSQICLLCFSINIENPLSKCCVKEVHDKYNEEIEDMWNICGSYT